MKQQLLFSALLWTISFSAESQNVDWSNPGNDKGGQRYSTLDQINRENVGQLKVAWTYHTKDSGEGTTIECTPLVIEGVAYVTTVKTRIAALNAATGGQVWSFDPYEGDTVKRMRASGGVNRGVAYWTGVDGARRVIVGLADGRLLSLDARTGRPDRSFGREG